MTTHTPPPPLRLTASTPEDLLAASAVVLGFWPTESVVMLTFDAAHPFHARVDLPPSRAHLDEVARSLVEPAVVHRVGRVVLLVHTADAEHGRAAWSALRRTFGRHGVQVAEALLVGEDRWFPLTARGGAAARGVPFDREALASHPFLAQAVVEGRVLHPSRDELSATLEPDPAAVRRLTALTRRRPYPPHPSPEAAAALLAEGTWVHALVTRHLAAGTRATDDDASRLLVGMVSLRVRDAAWSAITRAHARAAADFFADLARRAPAALRAAPATLTGWSAWQSGDGALAWCAVDRCREVEPDYGLCGLLAEALERAVPPSVWRDDLDWKEGLDGRVPG